jgi:hypothetical protein
MLVGFNLLPELLAKIFVLWPNVVIVGPLDRCVEVMRRHRLLHVNTFFFLDSVLLNHRNIGLSHRSNFDGSLLLQLRLSLMVNRIPRGAQPLRSGLVLPTGLRESLSFEQRHTLAVVGRLEPTVGLQANHF